MADPSKQIDHSMGGGAWKGGDRKKKRGRFVKVSGDKKKSTKKGLFALVLLMVFTLVFFLMGFLLLSSYLAAAVGEGWVHVALTVLLVFFFPLAIAFWAVRPMSGRQALWWWTGVFAAPYFLATVGLCLGISRRSALVLSNHGAWLPRVLFGPKDPKSVVFDRYVWKMSRFLKKTPEKKDEREEKEEKKDADKVPQSHTLEFGGKKWLAPQEIVIESGKAPRRGFRLPVVQRGGIYLVKGRVGRGRGKPGTFILNRRAIRMVLSPQAAIRLGLKISSKGPMEEISVKGGRAKYPVVFLDRVSVGKAHLNNVAVTVCGPCVDEGISGQLGIGFLKHFRVFLDEKKRQLILKPKRKGKDRRLDIEPFVLFSNMKARWKEGVVRIHGSIKNRGPKRIRDLKIDAILLDADDNIVKRLTTKIPKILEGKIEKLSIEGPSEESVVSYLLQVGAAHY